MQDFEKLGAFYLGKAVEPDSGRLTDELVLYDSKDLNTHAVIIGMTGSGKTGLGLGMLEEAAIDRIPVIAIDPKGDLGNILLTFPRLRGEDFAPWIHAREAKKAGKTLEKYAAEQAARWREGLGQWGQTGERIAKLRDSAELAIYTPGSSSGLPISVLQSFRCPPEQFKNDKDLYREKIAATATSVLALMGIAADPITSREHILISNILEHRWDHGQGLDIAALIGLIQQPPFERIGVMDMDSFYPAKERFALAMQLNNLLASPGFEAWMEGAPLDARGLFYTESGKPRVSVVSIAHLGDTERMFFVTMLLNEVLSWMRTQPGTGSLRAILYMDEIFGYMPPTANPPSKALLLTLLKQARAYGLGLVLATQNPVDLDYKGLSNTGTWFIGRLQTERDKMRVMEGLEGASGGRAFDKQAMERTLAGLGKRRFLLHNVHDNAPVVFETRWAMSYLAGPLTRTQIKRLMKAQKAAAPEPARKPAAPHPKGEAARTGPPPLPPGITQYFLPPSRPPAAGETVYYAPHCLAAVDVSYSSARYHVDSRRRMAVMTAIDDGPVPVDWQQGEVLDLELDDLRERGVEGAEYGEVPPPAADPKSYPKWERLLKRWIRSDQALTIYRSSKFRLTSEAGESEGEFRARLQALAREKRDAQVEKLRQRYKGRITTLQNRVMRAEQTLEREQEQARQGTLDAAIAFGTAILGAFLGRKLASATNVRRAGTVARKAGRSRKEASDVERAQQTLETARQRLADLERQFEAEVEKLEDGFDSQQEELKEVRIKPKLADIHVYFIGVGWLPE